MELLLITDQNISIYITKGRSERHAAKSKYFLGSLQEI